MTTPAVSLAVTVYNGERFLDEALASVRRQTFADFECVVWDDGSEDRSREIIAQHAEQDPRIRLFTGNHRGIAGALAAAHERIRAAFVGYLDQDDILEPTALRRPSSPSLHGRPSATSTRTTWKSMKAAASFDRDAAARSHSLSTVCSSTSLPSTG